VQEYLTPYTGRQNNLANAKGKENEWEGGERFFINEN